jgi:hypothetical protein
MVGDKADLGCPLTTYSCIRLNFCLVQQMQPIVRIGAFDGNLASEKRLARLVPWDTVGEWADLQATCIAALSATD